VLPRLDVNPDAPQQPKTSGTMNYGWGKDKDTFERATNAVVFTGIPNSRDKKSKVSLYWPLQIKKERTTGPGCLASLEQRDKTETH